MIYKSMVHTILDDEKIKPFCIKYYYENHDLEFGDKIHNILLVYKQFSI